MKIDLCCFWDGLAKYFDLLEDEKGPRKGVTQTLRLPWVVCNVKDWGKYVRRIWGIWKGAGRTMGNCMLQRAGIP